MFAWAADIRQVKRSMLRKLSISEIGAPKNSKRKAAGAAQRDILPGFNSVWFLATIVPYERRGMVLAVSFGPSPNVTERNSYESE